MDRLSLSVIDGMDCACRVWGLSAMNKLCSRAAASIAALAALSMTATPVLAHGYGHWRHHHRHGEGSDLLAGLLIVGGIAAIANAAAKSSAEKEAEKPYRYPDSPEPAEPDDSGYREAPEESSDYPEGARAGGGFDEAVDRCAQEIERGERSIDTIDNVARAGDRYTVEGRLADGRGYSCSVSEDGSVPSVDVDGQAMI